MSILAYVEQLPITVSKFKEDPRRLISTPGIKFIPYFFLLCFGVSISTAMEGAGALERVPYYQQRNFIAYRSHRKKKLAQFELFTRNLAL